MGKIILSTLYDDRRNGEYQNLFKNNFFSIFFYNRKNNSWNKKTKL